MTNAPQDSLDIGHLLPVGLRAFFRIARFWHLTDQEAASILGIPLGQLASAKEGNTIGMDTDTLFRIGNILAIYQALHTLLPVADRADSWIRRANEAPTFGGRRAIDLLTDGSIQSIILTRRYLESEMQT